MVGFPRQISKKVARPAIAAAVMMAALAYAGHASATPLTLNNASFELPTQAPGVIGPAGFITNWTAGGAGLAGVVNIPSIPGAFSIGAPDGNQVAYINGGSNISQTTGSLFQTNTTYTLSVFVGQDSIDPFAPLQAILYEGNTSQELTFFTLASPGPDAFGL